MVTNNIAQRWLRHLWDGLSRLPIQAFIQKDATLSKLLQSAIWVLFLFVHAKHECGQACLMTAATPDCVSESAHPPARPAPCRRMLPCASEVSDVPVSATGLHLSTKPDPPESPEVDRVAEALHRDESNKHTLAAKHERKVAEAKGPAVAVPKAMAKTVTTFFFNTAPPARPCPTLLMPPPLAQTTLSSLLVAQVRVLLQAHPGGVEVRTEVQPQNAGRC